MTKLQESLREVAGEREEDRVRIAEFDVSCPYLVIDE